MLCGTLSFTDTGYSFIGLFTPNDSVTITARLIDGTFDLSDGHCDGQNGLHTHFACQHNVCYSDSDEVAWYGRAFMRSLKAVSAQTSVLIYNIMFLLGMTI